MTATPPQAEPVAMDEPAQVGGEAHGELTIVDSHGANGCQGDCDLPGVIPTDSLPIAVALGLLIGVLTIAARVLRRRFWRRSRGT